MKTDENREIGELLNEIVENGFSGIEIDVDDSEMDFRYVSIYASDHEKELTLSASGESLVETLRELCDDIRKYIGKPSLAKELENLLANETEHETLPPIVTGPDAACRCGSRSPLVGERTVRIYQQWNGTFEIEPGFDSLPDQTEILSCQDCGRNYSFRERQN